MLRIHFLQQWDALADEALEDAIYDSQAMRDFIGIDLAVERGLSRMGAMLNEKALAHAATGAV